MVADTDGEAQEDRPDGVETDGHTATVPGDHLDGQDLDTTQVTVLISHQAGYQAGSPFRTTKVFRSPFRSRMAVGAITPTGRTYMSVMTLTTVQTSFTIKAVMTSAGTSIRITSGTTTRPASTTITTPRVATTSTANTMRTAFGITMTHARSTIMRKMTTMSKKVEEENELLLLSQLCRPEGIKHHLRSLQQLWQTQLLQSRQFQQLQWRRCRLDDKTRRN